MNRAQQHFLFTVFANVCFSSDITMNSSKDDVLLTTAFGDLRGTRKPTKSGVLVDYFLGVPFAEKPERLKKSELVHCWNDVYTAQKYPPKCIPAYRRENDTNCSEDCLYLNIIRPSGLKATDKLPVVVYIHGGGFKDGDGNNVDCEKFAENFVTKGIVVVQVQYRLGMLGFMSLGDSTIIPSNLGLWDMVTAFKFIETTIDSFNGDASNMTLMGHSAGAISASLLSMSPVASHYFTKYVLMGGCSWSMTRYKDDAINDSKKILEKLNCANLDKKAVMDCINSASLDDLYTAQAGTSLYPAFGDELLPDVPEKLIKNTKDQKVMIELMSLEAVYFNYYLGPPQDFSSTYRSTVGEHMSSLLSSRYGSEAKRAIKMATEYYLSANVSDDDYVYFMGQRSKFDSNIYFDLPILREAHARAQVSPSLYMFQFPYYNRDEFPENAPVRGSYHGHEFAYIWGVFIERDFEMNEEDRRVASFLVSSLVNFIKNGDPSSAEFQWHVYGSDASYTVVQPNPATDKRLFQADYDFWDEMSRHFKFDYITGLSSSSSSSDKGFSVYFNFFVLTILIANFLFN